MAEAAWSARCRSKFTRMSSITTGSGSALRANCSIKPNRSARYSCSAVPRLSSSVLRAPLSALFRRGDGWAAFVVQDGQARLRAVRVGHRGESDVEVLGGLAPGERVIVYPSDLVADGVKVREQ